MCGRGSLTVFLTAFLTTFFAPFFPFGASSFLSKKPITVGVGATVGARTAREAIADGFTNPSHLVEAGQEMSACAWPLQCFRVCAAFARRGLTRRRGRPEPSSEASFSLGSWCRRVSDTFGSIALYLFVTSNIPQRVLMYEHSGAALLPGLLEPLARLEQAPCGHAAGELALAAVDQLLQQAPPRAVLLVEHRHRAGPRRLLGAVPASRTS